jgi:hypothetical protein
MAANFDALLNAVPGLNQQAQQRAEAASQVQLQSQLGAAQVQPGQNVARMAQAAAPQQVVQAGAQQLAVQQQGAQQMAALTQGQLAEQAAKQSINLEQRGAGLQKQQVTEQQRQAMRLTKEELQSRKRLTDRELQQAQYLQQRGLDQDNRLQFLTLKQREDLRRIGSDTEDKIVNSRLQFERDEMGRKFKNERQLADWRILNIKNQQQFQRDMVKMKQDSERIQEVTKQAYNVITQKLEQEFKKSEAERDFEAERALLKYKQRLEKKAKDEAKKSRNRYNMWRGAGAVLGGVAGAFTPVGPLMGAKIGAELGGAAAAATE